MDTGTRRIKMLAVAAIWLLSLAVIVYAFFFREYAVPEVQVPCRATDGRVWVYLYATHAEWEATRHRIGEGDRRERPSARALASLDCDPNRISQHDLDLLENGVVESLSLLKDGQGWRFELRDELQGVYAYHYRYSDGRVVPTAATRRLVSLPAYGTFWLIVLGSLAAIIRRLARRRSGGTPNRE